MHRFPGGSTPNALLAARALELEELTREAEAVIRHFDERPVIEGNVTEEDARWVMRYDAVREKIKRFGISLGVDRAAA